MRHSQNHGVDYHDDFFDTYAWFQQLLLDSRLSGMWLQSIFINRLVRDLPYSAGMRMFQGKPTPQTPLDGVLGGAAHVIL